MPIYDFLIEKVHIDAPITISTHDRSKMLRIAGVGLLLVLVGSIAFSYILMVKVVDKVKDSIRIPMSIVPVLISLGMIFGFWKVCQMNTSCVRILNPCAAKSDWKFSATMAKVFPFQSERSIDFSRSEIRSAGVSGNVLSSRFNVMYTIRQKGKSRVIWTHTKNEAEAIELQRMFSK